MNIIANRPIGVKVLAAFSALLVITVALGTFALERLDAINQAAAEIRNDWLPSTRLLGGMAQNLERLRLNQAISASTSLDARRQDTINKAAAQIHLFQTNLENYQPLVSAGEEKRLADIIAAAFDRYVSFNTKLVAMLKSDPAQAAAFVDAQQAVVDELRGALQSDIAYNVREGDNAAVRGENLGKSARQWILIALGMTVVMCVAIGWSMTRSIAAPVVLMTGSMRGLAEHDMTVEISGTGRGDEIGAMARAVQVFKDSMIEADRLAAKQVIEQAAKERRQVAMDQHAQDFGTSISGVMASLAAAAGGMRQAADAMLQAASAVHEQALGTAKGAGQSSQELTAVAAAVEQMTASIDEIARQVAAAAEISREAVRQTETGQVSIRGLAEAASRIGDVVGLISSIAGQTNLLALNATIEAARAGDAGKGFAVVAGEVKALAAQTAKATAEIGSQITAIQSATGNAIAAVEQIGTVIGKMEHVSSAIASAVEEQSVTTRDIAKSVQAVTNAVGGAAQAMEQVVENAGQAGQVSQSVQREADVIGQQASKLRTEVDQFLRAIRTDTAVAA
jgi:methyl-accepting chemotaxis protein